MDEGENRSAAAGAGPFDEAVQTIAWVVCPLIKPMLDDESVTPHPCRQCKPHETGYGMGTPMCLDAAEEVVRATITAYQKATGGEPRGKATYPSPSQAAVLAEALEDIAMFEIDINFMADHLVWVKGLAREALARYRATPPKE